MGSAFLNRREIIRRSFLPCESPGGDQVGGLPPATHDSQGRWESLRFGSAQRVMARRAGAARFVLPLREKNVPGVRFAPGCVPTYVVREGFQNCTAQPPELRFKFPLGEMKP